MPLILFLRRFMKWHHHHHHHHCWRTLGWGVAVATRRRQPALSFAHCQAVLSPKFTGARSISIDVSMLFWGAPWISSSPSGLAWLRTWQHDGCLRVSGGSSTCYKSSVSSFDCSGDWFLSCYEPNFCVGHMHSAWNPQNSSEVPLVKGVQFLEQRLTVSLSLSAE